MLKRILCILLSLVMLFTCICGCNNTTPVSSGNESSNPDTAGSSEVQSSDDATSSEDNPSSEDTTSSDDEEWIIVDESELEETKISVPATTKKYFDTLPANYTNLLSSNPDRGFRSEQIVNVPADMETIKATTYEDVLTNVQQRLNSYTQLEKVTVCRLYFYMYEYRETYDLPKETVEYMEMYLRAYKEIGVKVYMCIYYQRGLEEDNFGASSKVILHHLDTYGKLWKTHQDTIYAVCFALIGSYGEWTAIKPAMTNADKQEIVDKVLKLLPKDIYLTMRMPTYKEQFVSASNSRYSTIGFAEDAFFGKMFPDQDLGQAYWRPADDNEQWQMAIKESPYTIMDSELFTTRWFKQAGIYVEPYSSIEAFSELHMTTFSIYHGYGDIATYGGDIKETVLYGWKGEEITPQKLKSLGVLYTPTWFQDKDGNTVERNCFEYVRDYLGYRISANSLSVTGGTKKGETVNVSMDLKNYGFSAAFNLKSGFAILDKDNNVVSEVLVGDPSTWYNTNPKNYSNRTQLTHNLKTKLKLPSEAGTYKLAFFLKNDLGQTARLDNTVEYSDGFNILHMFTID